jgi:hypothetical protein
VAEDSSATTPIGLTSKNLEKATYLDMGSATAEQQTPLKQQ